MRWRPDEGHVPRGFCGATGSLSDIRLVLVTAEPGDPLAGEMHDQSSPASVAEYSIGCLERRPTPFHQNIRIILDLCFPALPLEKQLKFVWRTNAVLCSARVESGPVPARIEKTCASEYLLKQIAIVPHAIVVALGGKAQKRLRMAGISALPALHPSCRESAARKLASWQEIARRVQAAV